MFVRLGFTLTVKHLKSNTRKTILITADK